MKGLLAIASDRDDLWSTSALLQTIVHSKKL